MAFLPDTNIMIAWMVRGDATVSARMIAHRAGIWLSSIVLHELYFGAFNSRHVERNARELGYLGLPPLSFDQQDGRAAGSIRAALKRAGTPIGPYDVLIAGQALARDLTLVTNNTREFSRVEGLKLADWTVA